MDEVSLSRIPKEFFDKQNILNDLLATKGPTWGVLPLITTNLAVNRTDYNKLYAVCLNKATTSMGATALRDEYMNTVYFAKCEYVFTEYLLNNVAVSAEDRIALGIHDKSTNHSEVPNPDTTPILKVVSGEPLQMVVTFRNPATGRFGKPKKVNFLDLRYKIGDPEPIGVVEAKNELNISRSGAIITFLEEDKGKQVYFYARWINGKGGAGPYTNKYDGPFI
jgi:hypothetical protein